MLLRVRLLAVKGGGIVDADDVMGQLEAKRSAQIATIYGRRYPGVNAWGVRFGDMDALVRRTKRDSELARQLWATGVLEARIVATRIMNPADLTEVEIDAWIAEIDWPYLADSFALLVYKSPFRDQKREEWTRSDKEFIRRAGFSLVYNAAADPASAISDDELQGYLDQIGREIHASPNWSREMMNLVPIAIGLRNPALKEVALSTATTYGTVQVFHGDKTNCKVQDAVAALNDPRTRVKPPSKS
jgi:hypothetical protein